MVCFVMHMITILEESKIEDHFFFQFFTIYDNFFYVTPKPHFIDQIKNNELGSVCCAAQFSLFCV